MANQLGKRYVCETCGSSVLCTKSGDGEIDCCEKTMEIQGTSQAPVFRLISNNDGIKALFLT